MTHITQLPPELWHLIARQPTLCNVDRLALALTCQSGYHGVTTGAGGGQLSAIDPSERRCIAFRRAVARGDVDMALKLLQDPRVDPNVLDGVALSCAVRHRPQPLCRLILALLQHERIGDISVCQTSSDFIRHLACNGCSYAQDICRLLMSNPQFDPARLQQQIFSVACCSGAEGQAMVQELLHHHHVPFSPLWLGNACSLGNEHVLAVLLQHDNDDVTRSMMHPHTREGFVCAASRGYTACVMMMMQHGLDPSFQNNRPLRIAAMNGHGGVVRALLQDERVDPGDELDHALRMAARQGHVQVVNTLVQHPKVDVSTMNYDAIARATMFGHDNVVRVLEKNLRQHRV